MNKRNLYLNALITVAISITTAQAADPAYQTYLHTLDAANPAPTTSTANNFEHANVDTLAYQHYLHTLDSGTALNEDHAYVNTPAPVMAEHVPARMPNLDLR
jgi:hypothetical protein